MSLPKPAAIKVLQSKWARAISRFSRSRSPPDSGLTIKLMLTSHDYGKKENYYGNESLNEENAEYHRRSCLSKGACGAQHRYADETRNESCDENGYAGSASFRD